MITVDLVQFVAVAFVVCGLAVVVWEIATKDFGIFREIVRDARGFAERPPAQPEGRDGTTAPAPASAGCRPKTPERAA